MSLGPAFHASEPARQRAQFGGRQADDEFAVEDGRCRRHRAGGSDSRLALPSDLEPFPRRKAVRDDRRLERNDRPTRVERLANVLGNLSAAPPCPRTRPRRIGERAHVPPCLREACPLVDRDRPLVERRHGEHDLLGTEPLAAELEAGEDELEPVPAARQVGAQPQPVLQDGPLSSK